MRRPSGRRFYLLPNIAFWPEPGNRKNGKDRKYAPLGLPGIFEYPDEEGGIAADSGLRCVFRLLHTLAPAAPGTGLGRTNIPDRRLELVCDDGPCYVLVRAEPEVG